MLLWAERFNIIVQGKNIWRLGFTKADEEWRYVFHAIKNATTKTVHNNIPLGLNDRSF